MKLAGFGNSNGIFNTALQLSTYQHAQGLIPFPKCLLRVLRAECQAPPCSVKGGGVQRKKYYKVTEFFLTDLTGLRHQTTVPLKMDALE